MNDPLAALERLNECVEAMGYTPVDIAALATLRAELAAARERIAGLEAESAETERELGDEMDEHRDTLEQLRERIAELDRELTGYKLAAGISRKVREGVMAHIDARIKDER